MFDTAGFEGVPNCFVSDGVERLHEVDCCSPHFDSPLVASLVNHLVRRLMVCCLVGASEPRLIFSLELVKSGKNLLYNIVVNSLHSASREQIPTSTTPSFLCITFILTFRHASGVNSVCFTISLKICLTNSFVSSSQALMSSTLIPLPFADLLF